MRLTGARAKPVGRIARRARGRARAPATRTCARAHRAHSHSTQAAWAVRTQRSRTLRRPRQRAALQCATVRVAFSLFHAVELQLIPDINNPPNKVQPACSTTPHRPPAPRTAAHQPHPRDHHAGGATCRRRRCAQPDATQGRSLPLSMHGESVHAGRDCLQLAHLPSTNNRTEIDSEAWVVYNNIISALITLLKNADHRKTSSDGTPLTYLTLQRTCAPLPPSDRGRSRRRTTGCAHDAARAPLGLSGVVLPCGPPWPAFLVVFFVRIVDRVVDHA
jgi:hypothetical protein